MNVTSRKSRYVLDFQDIDRSQIATVGGKGAHLGELWRIEGIAVPAGFCVTTGAFEHVIAGSPSFGEKLEQLSQLKQGERDSIRTLSAEIRAIIEAIPIPAAMAADIASALTRLGEQPACAVRSSATAEDLPTASFAGQQDSYLNIVGTADILTHVSLCWASLFTERAVSYRLRNGFDHHKVRMAVVVQRMVFPYAAGILFTADPVTGNRRIASVEASFGLGEALVSGLVNADVYQVRADEVIARVPGIKQLAIHAAAEGGTRQQMVEAEQQRQAVLTDAQVLKLAQLGRRIEMHFGKPQDIEWCLANDEFHIVQSRPITTLFPVPAANDSGNHIYLSVGHQQMMTDPLTPLGLSLFQLTALRPMVEAGGRLFVDVSRNLATPAGRSGLMAMVAKSDPLTGDALQTLIERGDFVQSLPDATDTAPLPTAASSQGEPDPAVIHVLTARMQAALTALKQDIQTRSGPALLDFILANLQQLKRLLSDPQSVPLIMATIEANGWLNEHMQAWLGEQNVADTLTLSVAGNITSEMGLALMDVADVIRPHREVVACLQQADDENFLDALPRLPGGIAARDAILSWLALYGMRCVGEIDVARPRWSERPQDVLPMLLANINKCEPGAAARRFEQGRQRALNKEHELLRRLRALPDGELKATETKRMIDRVRTFSGYREYPKYGWISHYSIYRQALLAEAARLVQAGVLRKPEDIFYLRFEELGEVLHTHRVDYELIQQRQDAHHVHQTLTPPRVLTSDGEAITGRYRRDDVPAGALVGLPVSTGVVEGRARIVMTIADAALEPDDILVTAYTDPSWTPLFVSIKALVTEVGSLMSHGSVIAREYGLPAVVGVINATHLIRDGQRIRVHGSGGYVEILS